MDKVLEEAKEHKGTDQMQVSLAAKTALAIDAATKLP